MTSGRDARRPVDVDAHVPLLGKQRLPRVQTHTHAEWARAESLLRVLRSLKRIAGPPERDEERITLRVHFEPAVPRECVSQYAPVLRKDIRIRIAQLMQEPCRPLHVGEEEGDSP